MLARSEPRDRGLTAGWPQQSEQHAQRRRLAGAIRTEQTVHLPRLHREGELVDGKHIAAAGKRKSLGKLLHGNHKMIVLHNKAPAAQSCSLEGAMFTLRPAVFLDRDGTLNV